MATHYATKYGVGATGSRLLSGNKECFCELEEIIAKDKNSESALILSSGFIANITILAALLDKQVLKNEALVFFDRLNHSSLYQGVFLSKAKLIRYRHLDMCDLENKLDEYRDDKRPKFIVSETLFSMDGDFPDIKLLIDIAKKHRALLYLDEAFATGIFGKRGYGFSTLYDFDGVENVVMGTFSKAIGVCGAYVACSQRIRDYLINKCSGFIYSTALSPMVIGAVRAAWELVPSFEEERKELLQKGAYLTNKLNEKGFEIGNSSSHIIPIILGSEEATLKVKAKLLDKKILASAIRPPTVPAGTSRLRISLTIKHTKEDLDKLLGVL